MSGGRAARSNSTACSGSKSTRPCWLPCPETITSPRCSPKCPKGPKGEDNPREKDEIRRTWFLVERVPLRWAPGCQDGIMITPRVSSQPFGAAWRWRKRPHSGANRRCRTRRRRPPDDGGVTSTLQLVALLILTAGESGAAPASSSAAGGPLQEQEINLKLRILVPRDQRPPMVSSAAVAPSMTVTALRPSFSSQVGAPSGSFLESVAALPPSLSAQGISVQPVSVVSSLAAVASGSSVAVPGSPSKAVTTTYRKVVPVRASYSMLPLPSVLQYPPPPRYPTAWTRPRPGAALLVGAAAFPHLHTPPPAVTTPQQTSPAAPRPELINITLIRGGKSAKECNCSKPSTAASTAPPPIPPEVPESPAPVDEDVEDVAHGPPPAPTPHAWAGYIPPDVLEHAKKVLSNNANGRVKLQKELDKVHFRQNWKQSNYPKKPVPGVGEDLWSALKDDLADLVKTTDADMKDVDDDDDAFHHRDPDFEEPMSDFTEDGRDRDELDGAVDNDEDPNTGQPYFVDFWGNRVPQYEGGFHDESETVEDSRKEYNNDPNGWNPDYPKGLWSNSDEHLQAYSGYVGEKAPSPQVQAAQSAPNQVRPVYDNGLGEGLEVNYNKYVLDNGTWVGPDPDPVPDDDLRGLMQDAVSHETPVQNPSELYPTYEDVVRYLNSRYPAQYQRPRQRPRSRPRPRQRPRPPPRQSPPPPPPPRSPRPYHSHAYPYRYPPYPLPYPLPLPLPLPLPPPAARRRPQPRPQAPSNNPNLVDVNQLVEALILHKEKERAKQQAVQDRLADESKDGDDSADDEEDDDAPEEVPVHQSNAHGRPPSTTPRSVCKGVKDVGLAADGQGMSHVRGVVCASTFDHSEEEGSVAAAAEGDPE